MAGDRVGLAEVPLLHPAVHRGGDAAAVPADGRRAGAQARGDVPEARQHHGAPAVVGAQQAGVCQRRPRGGREARRAAVVHDAHLGQREAVGDAVGGRERQPAARDDGRLADDDRGAGAKAQGGRRGVPGGAGRRVPGGEPQAARPALDAGEGRDRGRVDRQDRRPAAPHPRSRASAMRWAMRLCSENSSMKPGAAPCENEASALKVAMLRS